MADIRDTIPASGGKVQLWKELHDGTFAPQQFVRGNNQLDLAPANSDVRLQAVASTTSVEVIGRIAGWLALDIEAP